MWAAISACGAEDRMAVSHSTVSIYAAPRDTRQEHLNKCHRKETVTKFLQPGLVTKSGDISGIAIRDKQAARSKLGRFDDFGARSRSDKQRAHAIAIDALPTRGFSKHCCEWLTRGD